MENRSRKYRKQFWVTEEENKIIECKMKPVGFENFGMFARKMLIDGVVVNPVIPGIDEANIQMSKIGNNINQITRRINLKQTVEMQEMQNVKKEVDKIWRLMVEMEKAVKGGR